MSEVPPFLWADAGSFPSPKMYEVPGAGEVQPYTATATYVNASGQAILPALRLKSATGNLLALVFPSDTIADGATAEVSFVPPFGAAASSPTPPATAASLATGQIGQFRINFNTAAQTQFRFSNVSGSLVKNSSIYGIGDTNTSLTIAEYGLYQITCSASFFATQAQMIFDREVEYETFDGAVWNPPGNEAVLLYGTVPPGYVAGTNTYTAAVAAYFDAYTGINNPTYVNLTAGQYPALPVHVRIVLNTASANVPNPLTFGLTLTAVRLGDPLA